MNTRCPKVGDKQWSCNSIECTCHLRVRILFHERKMEVCGSAPCYAINQCSCLKWAEENK